MAKFEGYYASMELIIIPIIIVLVGIGVYLWIYAPDDDQEP